MKSMALVFSFILIQPAFAANPVKKSDYSHHLDEPVVPGTRVPIESLNTTPNDLELEEEHQKSRLTLRKEFDKKKENTAGKSPVRNDVRPKMPMEIPRTPEEKQSQESSDFPDQGVEQFTKPGSKVNQ
jgi:hypothetical protein